MTDTTSHLCSLLTEIRACRACENDLPLGPRPVLQAGSDARVLIVGQAPGARVHATGVPWNDKSGERLRSWIGVTEDTFYDPSRIALVPMGFCYPGKGPSGDLPPRRECAELWLERVLAQLRHVELTLLVGSYAQQRFLRDARQPTLTATVAAWRDYGEHRVPLPHPSPRNQGWFKHHPWFERDLVPVLRERVAAVLKGN